MKKQLKILSILDIPWFSALASYAIDQARGLKERGHKIFLGAPARSAFMEIGTKENFSMIEVPQRKDFFILSAIAKLKKFIETENIDIVLTHTGKTQTLACLAQILSKNKFPIIRTKSDARLPKKSFLLNRIKKIITASEFLKEKYLKLGIEPDKVRTIYQGIQPIKTDNLNTSPPYKVGILGRLDLVKGHSHFIEAASIVLKKRNDVSFLIAGKEANITFKHLKEQIDRLGISDSVKYLGYVHDQFEFINECNIGVIASTGSEVVSRVLLEWMACARPVIATNVGSIPEILPEKYLINPGVPKHMAEKLTELLDNPDNLVRIGNENQKIIEKLYNFKDFTDKTENLMFEILL